MQIMDSHSAVRSKPANFEIPDVLLEDLLRNVDRVASLGIEWNLKDYVYALSLSWLGI